MAAQRLLEIGSNLEEQLTCLKCRIKNEAGLRQGRKDCGKIKTRMLSKNDLGYEK